MKQGVDEFLTLTNVDFTNEGDRYLLILCFVTFACLPPSKRLQLVTRCSAMQTHLTTACGLRTEARIRCST